MSDHPRDRVCTAAQEGQFTGWLLSVGSHGVRGRGACWIGASPVRALLRHGSNPPAQNGWQRSRRRRASQLPVQRSEPADRLLGIVAAARERTGNAAQQRADQPLIAPDRPVPRYARPPPVAAAVIGRIRRGLPSAARGPARVSAESVEAGPAAAGVARTTTQCTGAASRTAGQPSRAAAGGGPGCGRRHRQPPAGDETNLGGPARSSAAVRR